MNIQEMHSAFRTIGQQMGLQLVRGILPESIDVYLNNVIQEKVQQEVYSGTRTVMQETVDTQSATMSNVNILRSLYRVERLLIPYPSHYSTDTILQGASDKNIQKWSSAEPVEFENGQFIDYYNPENGYHEILIPINEIPFTGKYWDENVNGWEDTLAYGRLTPMLYLGVSIEYPNTKRGNAIACRMIGADVLDTTLRDFCNGASNDSPIVTLLSKSREVTDENDIVRNIDQPYIQLYVNHKNTTIKAIILKFIKQPNVVKYDVDINNCINCDLPEYCHYEIVEKAVLKYQMSIGGGITSRDAKQ